VNETSEIVATTSDDNSSDTSDVTVYFDDDVFKEEEGTNEVNVSKKSGVIAKAPEAQANPLVSTEDYDDVYFDEEDLKGGRRRIKRS